MLVPDYVFHDTDIIIFFIFLFQVLCNKHIFEFFHVFMLQSNMWLKDTCDIYAVFKLIRIFGMN